MSWGYWGIVGGLVAMVATLFVCIDLVYPKTKGASPAPAGRIDKTNEADMPAAAGHRRAA
jgi:hypothetical protein